MWPRMFIRKGIVSGVVVWGVLRDEYTGMSWNLFSRMVWEERGLEEYAPLWIIVPAVVHEHLGDE